MIVGKGTSLTKSFSRLCILTLCLALGVTAAIAPTGATGTAFFPDIQGHWAERAIEKMCLKGVVRGYDDGTFRPNVSVSRLETVVMIIRALGLESQALTRTSIPAGFVNPDFVPSWATGHVALAVERGIISGTDLTSFRGSDPATRLEVTVFMVRMLGREQDALDRAGASLSFTDATSIPSAMRGYVAIIREERIMEGNPDGTFQPTAAITRAAMATILTRTGESIPGLMDSGEIRGTLSAVGMTTGGAQTITVRRDGQTTIYPVADNYRSYYRGDRVTLTNLIVGDDVLVVLDSQGRAVFIETLAPTQQLRGTISVVNGPPVNSLQIIRDTGHTETVYLTAAAVIRLDSHAVTITSLAPGQSVTITRSAEGTVTLVEAAAPTAQTVGTFVVYIPGTPSLIVVRIDGTNRTFQVAEGAIIRRDGVTAGLSQLQSGDGIKLQAQGDIALSILAETMDLDLTGTIEAVTFTSPPTLTVTTSSGLLTYPISSAAVIKRQGATSTLTALRKGDDVSVEIRTGMVTRIEATTTARTVSGTVQALYIAATPTITVRTLDGTEETYPVAANALIRQGRTSIPLSEIKPGYLVELRVESNEVVRILVEAVALLEDIKGTVEYIVDEANVLVITPDNAVSGQTKELHFDTKTIFIRNNKVVTIDDLEVGDRVIAIGSYVTGIFKATTIVVMTVSF